MRVKGQTQKKTRTLLSPDILCLFYGVSHNFLFSIARHFVAEWVSHKDVCVNRSLTGGIAPVWGKAKPTDTVSRNVGFYCKDSILLAR